MWQQLTIVVTACLLALPFGASGSLLNINVSQEAPTLPAANLGPSSQRSAGAVKPFLVWKKEKIKTAKQNQKIKKNLKDPNSYDETQAGRVSPWSPQAAEALEVSDYVVLYLSKLESPNKFDDAARHLSAKDVARLLQAYSEATAIPKMFPGGHYPDLQDNSVAPLQADQNR